MCPPGAQLLLGFIGKPSLQFMKKQRVGSGRKAVRARGRTRAHAPEIYGQKVGGHRPFLAVFASNFSPVEIQLETCRELPQAVP